MRKTTKRIMPANLWFVPIFFLILSGLACATQYLGNLIVGGTSVPFTLLGEVGQNWQAHLDAGEQYEVAVTRQESSHPLNRLIITVIDDDLENIAEDIIVEGNSAKVLFTAPDNGHVTINIVSTVGANQENLGEHKILITNVSK